MAEDKEYEEAMKRLKEAEDNYAAAESALIKARRIAQALAGRSEYQKILRSL